MFSSVSFKGALLSAAVLAAVTPGAAAAASRLIVAPSTAFAMRTVAAHNQLRAGVAAQPAVWDARLAASADAYAAQMARSGRFAHAPAGSRPGQGENLWMGTRGAFSVETMIGSWGSERSMFRPGQFPNVSTTGRWSDVGHYTQIIWPTSVRVGCALRSSASTDYFVCRYGQSGNVFGHYVGNMRYARR
jgi:hypothetical protein